MTSAGCNPIIVFTVFLLSFQVRFLGRVAKLSSNIQAEVGSSVLVACQMSFVVLSKYLQSVLVCLRALLELPDVSQVLSECFQLV